MSVYRYEAIDSAGYIVLGAMDAPDEAFVATRLQQMGYRPQQVKPAPTGDAQGQVVQSGAAGRVQGEA